MSLSPAGQFKHRRPLLLPARLIENHKTRAVALVHRARKIERFSEANPIEAQVAEVAGADQECDKRLATPIRGRPVELAAARPRAVAARDLVASDPPLRPRCCHLADDPSSPRGRSQ